MSIFRTINAVLGLALVAVSATAATRIPLPLATASYEIEVRLDPESHRLEAGQRVRWRNTSDHPASELRWHLYLNAFSHSDTTYLRKERPANVARLAEEGWGWIEITRLEADDRTDLLPGLSFISPDDGNPADRSVARLVLPKPVAPGDEIQLSLDFVAQLPRAISRTGFKGDFHLVAQWFPKLGVLDSSGAWRCHQFHETSEFYADFGDYDVSLTTPARFVVGATGRRVAEEENEDGTKTYRYRQRGVHDFAWTAWPDFLEVRKTFEHPRLPEVELILLLNPGNAGLADRYARALEHSLELFGTWYGPYPYHTLTLVDPAWGARAAGGMEYPTFITTGSRMWSPESTHRPEGVTVHEFAHQYFYGMVATDEAEESFLDEGVTTYATGRVLDQAYGPRAWSYRFWEVPVAFPSVRQFYPIDTSAGFFRRGGADPVGRVSWGYLDGRSYGTHTYRKMALLMWQAERSVGASAMEKAMRTYADRFRFGRPRVRDLVRVLSWETGTDLGPLFRQGLKDNTELDYAVSAVKTRPRRGPRGVMGQGPDRHLVASSPALPGFESEIVVRRLGGFRAPVTTELVFADGRTQRMEWDGEESWVRYRVTGPRLVSAEVDPDEKLVLDRNRLNNSRLVKPDRRASRRWGQRIRFWLQNLFESLVALA